MRYTIILSLCSLAFAQSDILRPTTDVDGGPILGIGCHGSNVASVAMPKAYDGTGSSTESTLETDAFNITIYSTRLFSGFSTSKTYTALTLNVVAASDGWQALGGANGNACIAYSVDGGSSWLSIVCDQSLGGLGFLQQTFARTLSATQSLSQVKLGVCTSGFGAPKLEPGADDIRVYDIWLAGSYSVTNSGTGSNKGQPHRGAVVVN